MNLSNLIGQNVTAIGDCGIYKDKKIFGKLVKHNQNETIIKNKYLCSVNPKTIEKYVVKLVVMNENTLGYIQPETPDTINILKESILKGGYSSTTPHSLPIKQSDIIRLASEKDFNEFNVSFEGYKNDPDYQYKI